MQADLLGSKQVHILCGYGQLDIQKFLCIS